MIRQYTSRHVWVFSSRDVFLVYFVVLIRLLQAKVSIKRLRDFLYSKDLDRENVQHYPQDEETGNSSVDFIKHRKSFG